MGKQLYLCLVKLNPSCINLGIKVYSAQHLPVRVLLRLTWAVCIQTKERASCKSTKRHVQVSRANKSQ